MGIFWGCFCLLCFGLLMAKAFTRQIRAVKADGIFMKIHKPVCVVLAAACLLHFAFVLPVIRARNILVPVTGALAVLFLAILFFHHVKKGKNAARFLQRHGILAGLMLLCIAVHIAIYFMDLGNYQSRISNIQLTEIDISRIADGQYVGEYDAGYIYAKVRVTVSNGNIQNISLLEHRNERGEAAEQVTSEIIKSRTFPVDAITGATNSSKVIQGAVQDALKGKDTCVAHRREKSASHSGTNGT